MREKAAKEEACSERPVRQQQPTQARRSKGCRMGRKNEWFGTDSAMTYTAFDLA